MKHINNELICVVIILLLIHTLHSQTILTPKYGAPAGSQFIALNQGRVNSVSDWKHKDGWKLKIVDWDADNKNDSQNTVWGNELGDICTPFTLNNDDYITGYTIYEDAENTNRVSGLTFTTRRGASYSCIANSSHTSSSASYLYGEYNFSYLTGFIVTAGSSMGEMQLQFTYATTWLTAEYGSPGGGISIALDQGRIYSILDWGIELPDHEMHIIEWYADNQTVFDAYGTGIDSPCIGFTLATDDYITGYTIYQDAIDPFWVSGLVFYTRYGNNYSCIGDNSNPSVTVNLLYDEYNFWYLTGWIVRSGAIIDQLQFQFTESLLTAPPTGMPTVSPTTTIPTTIPSNIPTLMPSNQPTYIPSNQPTLMPSNPPTFIPSVTPTNPSNQPTNAPSSKLVITDDPTSVPTNVPVSILTTQTLTDIPIDISKNEPSNDADKIIIITVAVIGAIIAVFLCCMLVYIGVQKRVARNKGFATDMVQDIAMHKVVSISQIVSQADPNIVENDTTAAIVNNNLDPMMAINTQGDIINNTDWNQNDIDDDENDPVNDMFVKPANNVNVTHGDDTPIDNGINSKGENDNYNVMGGDNQMDESDDDNDYYDDRQRNTKGNK